MLVTVTTTTHGASEVLAKYRSAVESIKLVECLGRWGVAHAIAEAIKLDLNRRRRKHAFFRLSWTTASLEFAVATVVESERRASRSTA